MSEKLSTRVVAALARIPSPHLSLRARTAAIDRALVECVEALETIACFSQGPEVTKAFDNPVDAAHARAALASLSAAVEGE